MSLTAAAAEVRRWVRAAARDGFAGVLEDEVAAGLARALSRMAEVSPEPWRPLASRAEGLERLGRQDRAAIVAQAMRLSMTLPATDAAPVPARARAQQRPGVQTLKGVGPKLADRLGEHGIWTVEDLACLLPRGYQDRRRVLDMSQAREDDEGLVRGRVRSFRQGFLRGGRFMATAEIDTESGVALQARWFHRVGGLQARMGPRAPVQLWGTLSRFRGRWSMVHPLVFGEGDEIPPVGVRHPAVPGVGPARLARLCRAAVEALAACEGAERLPAELAREAGFMGRIDALRLLHDPPADASSELVEELAAGRSLAHRSLAFEELFFVHLGLLRARRQWRAGGAAVVSEGGLPREELRAAVPFEPTGAQWRVLEEIAEDLASGRPMLRLLQGDVGSGKTLVAFGAALSVAGAGGQAAIMAPTEVLAEQHLRTLEPWCDAAGLRVALVTGRMRKGERASLAALVAAGKIDILVGTHALLGSDLAFARLGLVVVDEQHRFGVEQRARLRAKGEVPHLLVMTATPIPRTVALTAFGELDLSVIDELPPGRLPTRTRTFAGRGALAAARRELVRLVAGEGAQAFVICPLIERSEAVDATFVEKTAAALRQELPGKRVGVVHGRMDPAERDAVMASFREQGTDVLVATTVVEVGVDVASARAILVEHAERFGLAQLHQLRGRVGRGGQQGECLLHTASEAGSDATRRLEVLARCEDGFSVAEQDLALRGPGELFGTRQAGVAAGAVAAGALSVELVQRARAAAARILAEDPALERHPELAAELARLEASRALHGGEAG